MKFQKTLVAVAIAGIAATPMIASADTTLSGAVQMKIQGNDADVGGDPVLAAGDVLFGIVAEQELNSGLTGYGSVRTDLDQFSNGGADVTADNVYVGIKGGFGDIRIGEVPVVAEYGQVANDLHDVADDINQGMSYTGAFGPVGVGVNYSLEDNDDVIGVGVKFGLGGFAIGAGGEDRGGDVAASVGASFGFAGASVAVHYAVQQPDGNTGDDPTAIAVKVGYGFGGVSASLTVSQETDGADFESKMRLDLGYGLGGGMDLSTRINVNADHADANTEDLTDWRVQLSKSF